MLAQGEVEGLAQPIGQAILAQLGVEAQAILLRGVLVWAGQHIGPAILAQGDVEGLALLPLCLLEIKHFYSIDHNKLYAICSGAGDLIYVYIDNAHTT